MVPLFSSFCQESSCVVCCIRNFSVCCMKHCHGPAPGVRVVALCMRDLRLSLLFFAASFPWNKAPMGRLHWSWWKRFALLCNWHWVSYCLSTCTHLCWRWRGHLCVMCVACFGSRPHMCCTGAYRGHWLPVIGSPKGRSCRCVPFGSYLTFGHQSGACLLCRTC